MKKTAHSKNNFESSDCRDCYFRAHFKDWVRAEVLKIHRGGNLMPSLVFLDQFVATYEERRAPGSKVYIGKNGRKTEKFAYMLRRRGV